MKHTGIIEKGRESDFVAHCPAFKGCVSQGADEEETVSKIKEAIEAYVEAVVADGLPVPPEVGRETVEVEISSHDKAVPENSVRCCANRAGARGVNVILANHCKQQFAIPYGMGSRQSYERQGCAKFVTERWLVSGPPAW